MTMTDMMYEQVVTKHKNTGMWAAYILAVCAILALAVIGLMKIGFVMLVLAIVLFVLVQWLLFPKLRTEYEYSLVNHELEISAVYNKEKRKTLCTVDLADAEAVGPKGSPHLASFRPSKVRPFLSGSSGAAVYEIILPQQQELTCILLEPDETMLAHIRQWTGQKFFQS